MISVHIFDNFCSSNCKQVQFLLSEISFSLLSRCSQEFFPLITHKNSINHSSFPLVCRTMNRDSIDWVVYFQGLLIVS